MQSKPIYREVMEKDNYSLACMIRKVFEEHEAPRTGTVYSDPSTDNLYTLFRKPSSVLWVAEIDHIPLGCCGIFPTPGLDPDCAELVKYYLAKEARSKGIGSKLLQRSIQSAKALGYQKLYLESLPHFSKAISIYTRLGFRKLSKPLGNSGHPTCNIWMLLDLTAEHSA
jgi:putative acetyltransferase